MKNKNSQKSDDKSAHKSAQNSTSHKKSSAPIDLLKKFWIYFNSDGVIPWLLQLFVAFLIIKFVFFPFMSLAFGSDLPIVAVMSGSMEHRARDGIICGQNAPDGYKSSLDVYWSVCGAWYEERGITKEEFEEYPFKRGFNKGDIMFIVGPTRGEVKTGDVIVYEAGERYPIIHRVVNITQDEGGNTLYQTKGDYNGAQITQYLVVDEYGRGSACHVDGAPASCVRGNPVTYDTPGAIAILDETRINEDRLIGRAVLRVPYFGWVKIWFQSALEAVMK